MPSVPSAYRLVLKIVSDRKFRKKGIVGFIRSSGFWTALPSWFAGDKDTLGWDTSSANSPRASVG